MSRDEFDQLLERYLKNRCTPREEKLISQWYNSLTEKHNDISESSMNEIEARLWTGIEKRISVNVQPEKNPNKKSFRFLGPISIAAALVLLSVVGIFIFIPSYAPRKVATVDSQPVPEVAGKVVIKNTDSKVVKPVSLADGSLVILQPQGELSFDQSFSSGNREVNLTGEAFFEIKKDPAHPFVVHAEGLVTKVLGTSFNIKAKPNDKTIVVDVKTGKVAVYKEHQTDAEPVYHVTPNQQVVYDRNSEKIHKQLQEDPQVIITEEEMNEMRFDDANVSLVFDALEKTYGVELKYDKEAFAHCTLTTRMTNEGLREKLEIICKALSATYEINGTNVILEGKGCE